MAYCRLKTLVLLVVLAIVLFVSACQSGAPLVQTEAHPTISAQATVVTISYSDQEIQQRQQEVDQGHFALSVSEPAYTAMDYLASHFSEFGKVEKPPRHIKVVQNRMAVVEIESGDKKYVVTLKKLARQDETGAWFVTKIEIVPLKVPKEK